MSINNETLRIFKQISKSEYVINRVATESGKTKKRHESGKIGVYDKKSGIWYKHAVNMKVYHH